MGVRHFLERTRTAAPVTPPADAPETATATAALTAAPVTPPADAPETATAAGSGVRTAPAASSGVAGGDALVSLGAAAAGRAVPRSPTTAPATADAVGYGPGAWQLPWAGNHANDKTFKPLKCRSGVTFVNTCQADALVVALAAVANNANAE